MKKLMLKTILSILTVIIISLVILSGVLYFSPKPLFFLTKLLPAEANLAKPINYQLIEKKTVVERNVIYSYDFKNSLLDIYSPKKFTGNLPVILFIHGGGFFKGDKEMAKYFGPTLSDEKYIFVSLNYDLIPDVTIFDQLNQINKAIQFIKENAEKYSIDINKVNLAGSSAGGFLALQLLSAYNNYDYAKCLELKTVKDIKFNSILLYSAVYDLSGYQCYQGKFYINYLLNKMGWGMTGNKDWKNDKDLGRILNLNKYISKSFPPLFITDGNTHTFTEQANNYIEQLKIKSIDVKTLFFDSNQKVEHGYQLNMGSTYSKESIKYSLEFLRNSN